MKHTPENITRLEQNQIFVFGSNNICAHAGGAAFYAKQNFGAINGQPIGLQGDSYAIITLSFNDSPVSIGFIKKQIEVLYMFAASRPDLTFLVTKIGCGIAGVDVKDMATIFKSLQAPNNIILPIEFN